MSTSPRNATLFTVPTKVEDNCSYSASFMQQFIGRKDEESDTDMDAFQSYSSDLLRLKTLLFCHDEEDDDFSALAAVNGVLRSAGLNATASRVSEEKDDSKRCKGDNSQARGITSGSGTLRKSRITWELHPKLLLADLYDQVEEEILQSVLDGHGFDEDSRNEEGTKCDTVSVSGQDLVTK